MISLPFSSNEMSYSLNTGVHSECVYCTVYIILNEFIHLECVCICYSLHFVQGRDIPIVSQSMHLLHCIYHSQRIHSSWMCLYLLFICDNISLHIVQGRDIPIVHQVIEVRTFGINLYSIQMSLHYEIHTVKTSIFYLWRIMQFLFSKMLQEKKLSKCYSEKSMQSKYHICNFYWFFLSRANTIYDYYTLQIVISLKKGKV